MPSTSLGTLLFLLGASYLPVGLPVGLPGIEAGSASSLEEPSLSQELEVLASAPALAALPRVDRTDIARWQHRILTSKTLKVTCDIDDTWQNLSARSTTRDGPQEIHRERFHIISYMSKDDLCVLIWSHNRLGQYAGRPPEFELYWSAAENRVWTVAQNAQSPADSRAAITECFEPYGPSNPGFEGTRGCTYAAVTQSWLAGGDAWEQRVVTTRSICLMRGVELAILPPDREPGAWYDVFTPHVTRNERTEGKLYRRHDLMRLSTVNDQPQLSQWRTIIASGTTGPEASIMQVLSDCTFAYDFDVPRAQYEQHAASIRQRAQNLAAAPASR